MLAVKTGFWAFSTKIRIFKTQYRVCRDSRLKKRGKKKKSKLMLYTFYTASLCFGSTSPPVLSTLLFFLQGKKRKKQIPHV